MTRVVLPSYAINPTRMRPFQLCPPRPQPLWHRFETRRRSEHLPPHKCAHDIVHGNLLRQRIDLSEASHDIAYHRARLVNAPVRPPIEQGAEIWFLGIRFDATSGLESVCFPSAFHEGLKDLIGHGGRARVEWYRFVRCDGCGGGGAVL